MATGSNVVEYGIRCVVCHSDEMKDGERLFLMDCCKKGIHLTCVRQRFPDYRVNQYIPCPDCHTHSRASAHVVQRNHFTPAESDKIELCFLKHQIVTKIPMTRQELVGLRVAVKVQGCNAMRHVSHRVFIVGMCFWVPLVKEKMCEWEDIAQRLSLGLIWNNVSEMRGRYDLRVQRDGKGDAFHHFLDYLLEMAFEDDDVVTRSCVVKCCGCSKCVECKGFANVFKGERCSDRVAMANRVYFYQRVDKALFNSFAKWMRKKTQGKK